VLVNFLGLLELPKNEEMVLSLLSRLFNSGYPMAASAVS